MEIVIVAHEYAEHCFVDALPLLIGEEGEESVERGNGQDRAEKGKGQERLGKEKRATGSLTHLTKS